MEKLVPRLRFPGFGGEWVNQSLTDTFKIYNGYAFPSTASVDDGLLWVKIADVGINEMKRDSLSYLSNKFGLTHQKFCLKTGDYVVALTRPILNGKLKIAEIDDFFNGSLLNQRVGKLTSDKNNLAYVYFLLQRETLIKEIENKIAGSDPPNLSPNEISQVKTHIPDILEQNKIAIFFSNLDHKLKYLKKKKTLLETYKKGLMQKIFNQELRFKDEDGKDFGEWEIQHLGQLGNFTSGTGFKNDEQGGKKGIPFYKVSDMNLIGNEIHMTIANNYVSNRQIENFNYKIINAQSIIFAKVGAAIFLDRKRIASDFLIDNNMMAFSPTGNINFFYYLFQQLRLAEYAQVGALPSYNASSLAKIIVSLPNLKEQTKIANFLSAIDDKINLMGKEIDGMEKWKKGLLGEMFV